MTDPRTVPDVWRKATERLAFIVREAVARRKFTLPAEIARSSRIHAALVHIGRRWPDLEPARDAIAADPVFIFAAGWRSGSTLLQRLVCSSKEVAVWGEPLGDAAVIPRLAEGLVAINERWPQDEFFSVPGNLAQLSEAWIANLTPPVAALRQAHAQFLLEWLARPAWERFGVERWGLKEVRLTIDHARYLKWLFPRARFLFLYRSPYAGYRSWRGNLWASAWPGYFSWSPIAYARHWRHLVTGYLRHYREVDGYLVKFEDLVSGRTRLERIADHLGLSHMDPAVLDEKIRSPEPASRRSQYQWVTAPERLIIAAVCGSTARELGYTASRSQGGAG